MTFLTKDYLSVAKSRVTNQFKDKLVFNRFVELFLSQHDVAQQTIKDLYEKRDIDSAIGKQLDIIGSIVGQERELIDTSLLSYFGFEGQVGALGFDEAPFFELGESTSGKVRLDDDLYRMFIKAKIVKNITTCKPDEYLSMIDFIFGTTTSTYTNNGNASFTLMIGKELSPVEVVLLNYVSYKNGIPSRFIPKPLGVGINYGYFPEDVFGFEGMPNALTFGEMYFDTETAEWIVTGDRIRLADFVFDGSALFDGTLTFDTDFNFVIFETSFAGRWAELIV